MEERSDDSTSDPVDSVHEQGRQVDSKRVAFRRCKASSRLRACKRLQLPRALRSFWRARASAFRPVPTGRFCISAIYS